MNTDSNHTAVLYAGTVQSKNLCEDLITKSLKPLRCRDCAKISTNAPVHTPNPLRYVGTLPLVQAQSL